jgi:MYXO-CTERM domain-containing protein
MTRLILLLALGGLFVPSLAAAYFVETRSNDGMGNPVPVAYDTSTDVEFRIASAGMPGGDGSEFAAIAAAFQTWSDVECSSINFVEGAREDTPAPRHWQIPGAGRYILVYWSDDAAIWDVPRAGFFEWAHDTTGVLIGGTVILNSLNFEWSTADGGEADRLDVQGTVTALVGRVLGITSTMEGNATYPVYVANDVSKRTLGTDDIAAIQYIYGPGAVSPVDAGGVDGGTADAGMACMDAPPPPEASCDMTTPDCPPPVDTMPGDAGVINRDGSVPGVDSGPPPGTDAGTTPPSGDDDGCSCDAAPGATNSSLPGALALLALVALVRRRRR